MMMLALPASPERKMLGGYVIAFDLGSGPDVGIVQKWYENGRYQCFINGRLVVDEHIYERPPFVIFK